jgi:quinohemoprotein ethanol dehydrogenase
MNHAPLIRAALLAVAAVAQSLHPTCVAAPADHTAGGVDPARVAGADREPGQWLVTGRDSGGSYFSPLTQISDRTVERLGLAWEFQTGTSRGLEATPLVVDGVMYTSGNWGSVYALDARSGALRWSYLPIMQGPSGRYTCCDAVNRGVAVWRGKVYVGTTDGHLVALDARTGHIAWSVDTIVDHRAGYSSTGAPLVAGDVVLLGNGGGDLGKSGTRNYVSAYDVRTGRLRWRFFVVPSRTDTRPDRAMQMALRSWDPAAEPRGGAVWAGMSYDARLGLVYLGTGNAAPYQEEGRNPGGSRGDDLFCSSIVALDARTGRYVWHYQTTPGDNWDQDAAAPMVLADVDVDGKRVPALMQASKNGFFYVLDRRSGRLVSGKPFTYVNWAKGLDASGRPITTAESDYSQEAHLIYPSMAGAHSWPPMAYSPTTRLAYIPVIDAPMVWFGLKRRPIKFIDGSFGVGALWLDKYYNARDYQDWFGALPAFDGSGGVVRPPVRNVLRAWDPVAQRVAWEQETARDFFVYDGGTLATAGNLVFQGRASGQFVAYAADTGRILKAIETGTGIMAAPMTYEVDGVQYVAVMAGYGGGAVTAALPETAASSKYQNLGRILVFRLDGAAVPLPPERAPPAWEPPPTPATTDAGVLDRGARLYLSYCSRCHSFGTGVLPDLRRLPAAMHAVFPDIVLRGALGPLGMGRFDDVLSPADADAIHAFLVSEAWKLAPAP